MKPSVLLISSLVLSALVSACGGGGGSGGSASPGNGTSGTSNSSGGSTATTGGSGSGTGSATPGTPDITITVAPTQTHAISPYIYGLNGARTTSGAPGGLTFDRAGGNRWTAYNWETNASNAGSDYLYESDNFLSSSTVAAAPVTALISSDQAAGIATLFTVQMQGLVAGDEAGPVSTTNAPDLARFKSVVFQKSSQSAAPFTTTPVTTDASVYIDEFVWAVDQAFASERIFSTAPVGAPVFIQLDNEPELWNTTHLEVQGPTGITASAYIQKTIALTTALKTQFPDAVIFGPVHYGFAGIYNWQGQLAATPNGSNWFPDVYLPAIRTASQSFGRPLVDVYDFHWYSEATDGSGNRVTGLNSATLTDAQIRAIVQSPRSLWDTSYTENSWITSVLGQPIALLGRLQSRISSENPGMKIALSEYNNGGAAHIAGTIAEADDLGIFGTQGIFAASLWPLSASQPYIMGGFSAYRNFDGNGANFGDISVDSTSSDVSKVAAYVSTDSSHPGRVVMVLINRSTSTQLTAVNGIALSGTVHVYQMTAATAQGKSTVAPVALGTQAASGSSLSISLPALSVTTVDVH